MFWTPDFQDGKKIPKWIPRARRGQFLGFSDDHSLRVGKIRNLVTGHVSSQFHVVYDDHFTTVSTDGSHMELFDADTWTSLLEGGYERAWGFEYDDEGRIMNPPPELDESWLSESERRLRDALRMARRHLQREHKLQNQVKLEAEQTSPTFPVKPIHRTNASPTDAQSKLNDQESPFEDDTFEMEEPLDGLETEFQQEEAADGIFVEDLSILQDNLQNLSIDDQDIPKDILESVKQLNQSFERIMDKRTSPRPTCTRQEPERLTYLTVADVKNARKYPFAHFTTKSNKPLQKVRAKILNDCFLQSLDWDYNGESLGSQIDQIMSAMVLNTNTDTNTVEEINPFILLAKANAEDNPNWHQAMNGPFKDGFWEATRVEINTLENEMNA